MSVSPDHIPTTDTPHNMLDLLALEEERLREECLIIDPESVLSASVDISMSVSYPENNTILHMETESPDIVSAPTQ